MQVDSVACLLDFENDCVARAMKAAYGEAVSPVLFRFQKGRPQPLRADDVRRLIASLRAIIRIAEDGDTGVGVCEVDRRVEVILDASHVIEPEDAPSVEEPFASASTVDALGHASPHPLQALDRQLVPKLVEFAQARVPGFPLRLDSPASDLDVFLATTLEPFEGRTVIERFLADGGPALEERAWLTQKAQARLSLWEVEAASFDEVALIDLLDGRRAVVHDVAMAEGLRHRDGLCAAVVDANGVHLVVASHPVTLLPNRSRAVADAYRKGPPSGDAFAAARALADAWAKECAERTTPGGRAGGLRTTDGEPFVPGEDVWSFPPQAQRQVEAALDAAPGFHRRAPRALSWTWSKRGNARHPDWWRTALGEVALEPGLLRHAAASTERLDRARRLLEAALPGVLRHERRESSRDAARAVPLDAAVDAQVVVQGPWTGALSLVQALAGAPDASKDAANCAEVHTRACLFESREARALDEDADVDLFGDCFALSFRRITGVSSDGRYVGPDELWVAMGAGVHVSMALQALVAPLLMDFAGDPLAQLRDAARVGWAVWNAVREEPDTAAAVQRARRQLGLDGAAHSPPMRKSKQRRADEVLAPSLEHPSNAALLDEALPWAVHRARAVAWDRRVVEGLSLRKGKGAMPLLEVVWRLPKDFEAQLRALGYREGLVPMKEYDQSFDPRRDGFVWRAVRAPWRREVLAAWYRDTCEAFHGDFDAQLTAHVAVLDAVVEDSAPGLRDAWGRLLEVGLDQCDVALALVRGMRTTPALSLKSPGKDFAAALARLVDELVDEEVRRAADW